MPTVKLTARLQFASALGVAWMFADRWNAPGAVGTVSHPNPVGRTLTIGTNAGEYQFVYQSPVPKSIAELALRMQAAFPHVRVLVKQGVPYEPPSAENVEPRTSDGVTFHPMHGQAILFDMLAGGDGAVIYVAGGSLAPLLGLQEGSTVTGRDAQAPYPPGYIPTVTSLATPANIAAAMGSLVANPTINGMRSSYAAIMAKLGGILTDANVLYKEAKYEATEAIEGRIADFRAQILPTFRRLNSYANESAGSLVMVATSASLLVYEDFAMVEIPNCKAGDDVTFTAVGTATATTHACTMKAVYVEDYGVKPPVDAVGGSCTFAANTTTRFTITGRRTIVFPGTMRIYLVGKRSEPGGGTLACSDLRIDATHSAIVKF